MEPFVTIEGVDSYQDFWNQLKPATNRMFQSDLGILILLQEEMENKTKKIIKEKERIFNLIQILNSDDASLGN